MSKELMLNITREFSHIKAGFDHMWLALAHYKVDIINVLSTPLC